MKKTTKRKKRTVKKSNGLQLIQAEHNKAKLKYKDNFSSNHEGFAVLKEEVDELWDEVKRKHPSNEQLREEAIQIGAMALRFLNELTHA